MLVLVYVITLITMHLTAFLQSDSQIYVGYLAPVAIGAILVTLAGNLACLFQRHYFQHHGECHIECPRELFDFQFGLFAAVTSCVAIFYPSGESAVNHAEGRHYGISSER